VSAVPTLTRDQAAALVKTAVAERDTIQQNLLDLDGSFGKRLLAGATLTGETKRRWDAAAADLAMLWDTFTSYSAVVDRAAEIIAGLRRSPAPQLAQVSSLLYGTSVQLNRASSALSRGDLTSTGVTAVTVFAAVKEMKPAFASVADVVGAAEAVWNAAADQLQQIEADLGAAKQQAAGFTDETLTGALAAAETDLAQLREVLNGDPLSLWRGGQADLTRLGRLRDRTAAAVSRAARQRGPAHRRRDDGRARRPGRLAGCHGRAAADHRQDRCRGTARAAERQRPGGQAGLTGHAARRRQVDQAGFRA